MLGTELSLLLEDEGLSYTGTDCELDITNREGLLTFVEGQQEPIGWIVNCAAYTAVDKAEDDKENCRLLNTEGAENIAVAAERTGAKLIHISTDYVFNGQGNKPYTEDDDTDPIGVYGLSKRDGEDRIPEKNVQSYIIRTAWLYGKHGKNFVFTMLRLMKERKSISVVNDQRGSPTWTRDLAETIIAFIGRINEGKSIPYGIYHFTKEAEISWYDFAREIHAQGRALGILPRDCDIVPCTSADFPARVKRPAYSVLDKAKIKNTLGINIPAWDMSLRKFLETCVN
jgi:dTDP-4-dehydrorhamnose reductase